MSKKKIRDTKVGKWLSEKAPAVLDAVGDALPDQGVLGMVKRLVDGEPDLTPEQKLEFERMLHQHEMSAQENVTRRWEADMRSDVPLAKYIRPSMLIALFVVFVTLTVWDGIDQTFMPPENYLNILELLMLTVFGAYFAGRTIEKATQTRNP
jgi:hypothetical protein